MRRGEIRRVELKPVRSGEANKLRPTVIVSNDGANTTAPRLGRGVVTVVPVTTNINKICPFQVLLPATETGLREDSKAQAEQVRSVALQRLGARVGMVPVAKMTEPNSALRLHLALWRHELRLKVFVFCALKIQSVHVFDIFPLAKNWISCNWLNP